MAGVMVQTINEAVAGIAKQVAEQIADTFRKQFVFLRYEQDRLEQYSRRETVRIVGMEEETGENLNGKVMNLAESMGCGIVQTDVSVCHRVGYKRSGGSGSRPVLVRFVNRGLKYKFMKDQKMLKQKAHSVYINEDLTSFRAQMLQKIKAKKITSNFHTRDGKIFCYLKTASRGDKPIIVDTIEDLFKLGFTEAELKEMEDNLMKFSRMSQPADTAREGAVVIDGTGDTAGET